MAVDRGCQAPSGTAGQCRKARTATAGGDWRREARADERGGRGISHLVSVSFKTAAAVGVNIRRMEILFVASVAPIAADPPTSQKLYVDALGLPLSGDDGYV